MNRRFRLGTVERLREALLSDAGTDLARAGDAADAAVRHRDALAEALLASRNPDVATPPELSVAAHHRDRLRDERAAAEEEIERCLAVLDAARAAWLQARADLRAVQALHDRHRALLSEQDLRREQRGADEAAGVLASRAIISAARRRAGDAA